MYIILLGIFVKQDNVSPWEFLLVKSSNNIFTLK